MDERMNCIAIPPLAKIAAALRKTTETLAHEVAVPSRGLPDWTEFEWRIARAAAAMQGISSLLHQGLYWRGPESWQVFLQGQWEQSVERRRQIAALLDAIDSQARREGMALLALKGAALYASGIYAGGERPMGDVDLLIRNSDAQGIAPLLRHCGYDVAFTSTRHQVFKPREGKVPTADRLGEQADSPIKIEVHTAIEERLPVKVVNITQFLFPSVLQPGLNAYPSTVSLMLHLLLHAAGNIRARALRLIQLHDIALLAARFLPSDWEGLLGTKPEGQELWWAFEPLTLTARYYPGTVPPSLLARLSAECPWLLGKLAGRHQLTDVSWSNIRVAAFPGVEWSRTPLEALNFVSSRIWPSRKARLELDLGAAEIPASSTVPWYGISHSARILRWLFSSPPRVQTLLSVRAALAQET
jgi:putative nucleotidyltransferase-like protein